MNIICFSEVNCFPYRGLQNAQTLAQLFGVAARKNSGWHQFICTLGDLAEMISRLEGESGRPVYKRPKCFVTRVISVCGETFLALDAESLHAFHQRRNQAVGRRVHIGDCFCLTNTPRGYAARCLCRGLCLNNVTRNANVWIPPRWEQDGCLWRRGESRSGNSEEPWAGGED